MTRCVATGAGPIEYELIQTGRRDIEMRATEAGVRVFAPRGVRLREADAFVRARAGWIIEARTRMRAYRVQREAGHPVADGARVLVEGQVRTLRTVRSARRRVEWAQGEITVHAPDEQGVRGALKDAMADRARARIGERIAHFQGVVGRAPGRVAIRDQRTRWGSCSSLGNLNFNWKLIMAPPEALDYVVVHELCHLFELNHARAFWERVGRVLPDYAVWKKWLKDNGHILGV